MVKKILINEPWYQTSNEYMSEKKNPDFVATTFYGGDSIEIEIDDRLNSTTLDFDKELLAKFTKFLNEICADLGVDLD